MLVLGIIIVVCQLYGAQLLQLSSKDVFKITCSRAADCQIFNVIALCGTDGKCFPALVSIFT